MIASEVIKMLERLIEKHGDLPLYAEDELHGESELSGVKFEDVYVEEILDYDGEYNLPKRFFLKF